MPRSKRGGRHLVPHLKSETWVDLEMERRNYERRAAKYGVTADDVIQMKAEQGGRCAICHRDGPLVIDHDHLSGEVRGLLCNACNLGIGLFQESAAALAGAIFYLGRAQGMKPNTRPEREIDEPSLYRAWRTSRIERSRHQEQRDRQPPTDQEGDT